MKMLFISIYEPAGASAFRASLSERNAPVRLRCVADAVWRRSRFDGLQGPLQSSQTTMTVMLDHRIVNKSACRKRNTYLNI
jgi:hypothetical protein